MFAVMAKMSENELSHQTSNTRPGKNTVNAMKLKSDLRSNPHSNVKKNLHGCESFFLIK